MKLFRSTITITYYSFAKNWQEADGFADDAISDSAVWENIDTEETDGRYAKSDYYTPSTLVYHRERGKDISLAEALKLIEESKVSDQGAAK